MDQTLGPNEKPTDKADDFLQGADAIAEFIFGDKSKRRRVYYLAERTRGIPIHRIGAKLCLRKSAYRRFVEAAENRSVGIADKPAG